MTMSHASVLRILNTMGNNHDEQVSGWRDALKQFLAETTVSNECKLFIKMYFCGCSQMQSV